ncbi:uncharacterized protein METZ01_LOCUS262797, partial [marine metagenome]
MIITLRHYDGKTMPFTNGTPYYLTQKKLAQTNNIVTFLLKSMLKFSIKILESILVFYFALDFCIIF